MVEIKGFNEAYKAMLAKETVIKPMAMKCIWILLLRRILSIKIPIFFQQGLY